jgi:hypothetical protein
MSNVSKGQGLKKCQHGKNTTNKGSTTKLIQGQPNTMEVWFVQLEALVISMVTQMKSNAYGSKNAKNQKNNQSYSLDIDPFNIFWN